MGHYTEADIPFSYVAVDEYVLFDVSSTTGSVPNRMFWITGTAGFTDIAQTSIPRSGWGDLPTIFDSLQRNGISWKFYVENYDPSINYRERENGTTNAQLNWVPCWRSTASSMIRSFSHIVDLSQYFVDLEKNQLPAVSYIATMGSMVTHRTACSQASACCAA